MGSFSLFPVGNSCFDLRLFFVFCFFSHSPAMHCCEKPGSISQITSWEALGSCYQPVPSLHHSPAESMLDESIQRRICTKCRTLHLSLLNSTRFSSALASPGPPTWQPCHQANLLHVPRHSFQKAVANEFPKDRLTKVVSEIVLLDFWRCAGEGAVLCKREECLPTSSLSCRCSDFGKCPANTLPSA